MTLSDFQALDTILQNEIRVARTYFYILIFIFLFYC